MHYWEFLVPRALVWLWDPCDLLINAWILKGLHQIWLFSYGIISGELISAKAHDWKLPTGLINMHVLLLSSEIRLSERLGEWSFPRVRLNNALWNISTSCYLQAQPGWICLSFDLIEHSGKSHCVLVLKVSVSSTHLQLVVIGWGGWNCIILQTDDELTF